jgi:predicted TPR repeat methyltransferase
VKSELTQAIECLTKAFELDPINVETGKQLAQALRHVGRTEECETVCKKILETDPENAEALFFQDAYSKQKNNEMLERVPADVTRQIYNGKNIGQHFDNNLKYTFEYKAPEVLNSAVRVALEPGAAVKKIDILELGCGSGL